MSTPTTAASKWLAIGVAVLFMGLCVAVGVIMAEVRRVQFLAEPPSEVAAAVGAGVFALVGFLLARRMPSTRGGRWGVAVGIGLVGLFGGAITPAAIDVLLDESAATLHPTVVRERGQREVSERYGKRERHFVVVDPWPGAGAEPVHVWVPRGGLEGLHVGTPVHVHVRDGRLGFPWIERVTRVDG